jgi:hypothetical protein
MAMDVREVVIVQEVGGLLANAPWWLISAGIHVVLLLVAGLVYMERAITPETEFDIIVTQAAPPPLIPLPEPGRADEGFVRRELPKEDGETRTAEEPTIFFPMAEMGDHIESADNEPYHQMKGDSKQFLSYLPGTAGGIRGAQPGNSVAGVYDTMGVGAGGGSGGRYGRNDGLHSWLQRTGYLARQQVVPARHRLAEKVGNTGHLPVCRYPAATRCDGVSSRQPSLSLVEILRCLHPRQDYQVHRPGIRR